MYEYKNTTNQDIDLVGHGIVKAGAVIRTEVEINNPNLQLVSTKDKGSNSVVGTEVQQPNAVVNAAPVQQPAQTVVNPVGEATQGGN